MKKDHEKNFYSNINLNDSNTIPKNFEIKAENSTHIFNISLEICKKSSIRENTNPNQQFNISGNEVLSISAELINKNERFFNKSNEEIEAKEFYNDIYTLGELKNNVKGFEFFMDLITFKNSFLRSLEDKNCELLILKDILLLNIHVENFLSISKTFNLTLSPCINKKKILNKGHTINNAKSFVNSYKELKLESIIIPRSEIANSEIKFKDNSPININLINKKHLLPKNEELINGPNWLTSTKNDFKQNYSPISEKSEINYDKENFAKVLPKYSTNNLSKIDFIESLINKSEIIKDINEENLISKEITNNFREIKYRLIFKASRDGDSAPKFHSLCDELTNLIILIKTKKGLRFGGFTSNKFRTTSHLKFDNKAFLFSLDNKKVYKVIPGEYAIYCYENTGPCFAKRSLYIPNKFFKRLGKTCGAGGPYQFKENYELNGGIEQFYVEEMEVFQIQIDKN